MVLVRWPTRGEIVTRAGSDTPQIVDDTYCGTADCKRCGGIHPDFRLRGLRTERVPGCLIVRGTGAGAPPSPPAPLAPTSSPLLAPLWLVA